MTKLEQAHHYIDTLQIPAFFELIVNNTKPNDKITLLQDTFIYGVQDVNFLNKLRALANMLLRENNVQNDVETITNNTNIASIADKTDFIVEYEYNEREMRVNENDLTFDVIAKKELKLKVLASGREWVSYTLSTGSSTALGYEDFDIELMPSSSRKQGFMEIDKRHNSKFKQTFRVNFIPSLKEDEEIEINLKWITKSLRFISFEDFQTAKVKGNIQKDTADHVFTKKITEISKHYLLRLIFPQNFPLNSSFSFSARKNMIVVESEQKRLSPFFKVYKEDSSQKIILEIDVQNPIRDVTYGLRWIPPYCSDLLSKKLLTKSQVEKILERSK